MNDIFELMPGLHWVASSDGVFLRVGGEWEQVLGYSREEILSKPVATLLHPDDIQRFKQAVVGLAPEKPLRQLMIRLRHKDGSCRSFEWSAAIAEGVVYASVHDVSLFRQMELELRQKTNLLDKVINSSRDYIFVKDVKLRTILCNTVFAQAQNKVPYELYGKTDIENGCDPELVKGNPEKGIRGFEQDDLAVLEGGTVHSGTDVWDVRGEKRFFDSIKVPLKDNSGKVVGLIGISRDITDRMAADRERERLLSEANRNRDESELILASQSDTVLLYDLGMNVRRVNPSFLDTFGFDPVGLNLRDIVRGVSCRHMDGHPLVLDEQPTPRALRGEKIKNALFLVTRKDGSTGVVETSSQPLMIKGEISGTVTVWHDITDLKNAEEELRMAKENAEEASRVKDKFVSLLSHDLKSPLGGMIGFLKLVRDDSAEPLSEGAKLILDRAIDCAKQMAHLIDNLLGVSRLKTGQLKLERQFFDAKYLGVKMMLDYSHLAGQKGIKMMNVIPENSGSMPTGRSSRRRCRISSPTRLNSARKGTRSPFRSPKQTGPPSA